MRAAFQRITGGMASSPIRINEATANQLIALPGINTTRARRIVRFRTRVGELNGIGDMTFATGLAAEQLAKADPLIDWSPRQRETASFRLRVGTLVGPALAALVLAAVFLGIEPGSGSSLLARIAGALIAVAIAGASLPVKLPLYRLLRLLCQATLIAGTLIMIAVAGVAALLPGEDGSLHQVLQTFWFLLLLLVITLVLFGPQWIVDHQPGLIPAATGSYDYLRIGLLPLGLLAIQVNASSTLIEELFGLWAGIMLIYAATDLYQGENTFEASLASQHQAKVRFLADVGDIKLAPATASHRRLALLSLVAGLLLLFGAACGLLAL